MIDFDSVLLNLKKLKEVEMISSESSDTVVFKKGDSTFLLTRNKRADEILKDDFTLAMATRPASLENCELDYLSKLEIINKVNISSSIPCKLTYRKDIDLFFAEVNHMIFSQGSVSSDEFIKENLNHYIPMALLGMMMLIFEMIGKLDSEIKNILSAAKNEAQDETK
ncbi:TPA: hypothetical protein QH337_001072 [Enterobacter ludwigii]|nr:hypothetical protein [Enterobacter ludwigii]